MFADDCGPQPVCLSAAAGKLCQQEAAAQGGKVLIVTVMTKLHGSLKSMKTRRLIFDGSSCVLINFICYQSKDGSSAKGLVTNFALQDYENKIIQQTLTILATLSTHRRMRDKLYSHRAFANLCQTLSNPASLIPIYTFSFYVKRTRFQLQEHSCKRHVKFNRRVRQPCF